MEIPRGRGRFQVHSAVEQLSRTLIAGVERTAQILRRVIEQKANPSRSQRIEGFADWLELVVGTAWRRFWKVRRNDTRSKNENNVVGRSIVC